MSAGFFKLFPAPAHLAMWALGLCLTGLLPAHAQSLSQLDTGRMAYRQESEKIETQLQTGRKTASETYLKELKIMLQRMEAAGDDFGVRPTTAEIKRFEQSGTIPEKSDVGTPEAIQKARIRYHETLARLDSDVATQRDTLVAKYAKYLSSLKTQLETAGKTADAGRVAKELDRIKEVGGDVAQQAAAGTSVSLKGNKLPKELCSGLRLLYDFEAEPGQKVQDRSGWKQKTDLTGGTASRDPGEGANCSFSGSYDVLEPKAVTLGSSWSVFARVQFPLANRREARVLVSSAHGKHHLLVNAAGELGIQPAAFVGCGYNVNALKGWHDIAISSGWNGTFLFVDGKHVGTSKLSAPFPAPVAAIGNSAAGGSPWGGAVASLLLWTRGLTSAEIAELHTLVAGK